MEENSKLGAAEVLSMIIISVSAASSALQSLPGVICDSIGNLEEADCPKKNVMAASNALSCANIAKADFTSP